MWSSGEEHVRVMAFVGLTKLLPLISTTLVDFAIKVCLTMHYYAAVHILKVCHQYQSSLITKFSLS